MHSISVFLRELAALSGIEQSSTSHAEKLSATLGALLGVGLIALLSLLFPVGHDGLLLASLGATAVLLFVVPHGALSQPWPVLGGHLLSALIGVACRLWLPEAVWVPALAVALAIAAMQYLRCVHPPGGATALAAVVGGPELQALGFGFVFDPVLLHVITLLVAAVAFNNLFPWRRYPAHLMKITQATGGVPLTRRLELTQEDFEAALQKLDTFVDIGTEELIELVDLARQHAEANHPHPAEILPGRSYSNGRLGRHWSVRQVIDQSGVQQRKPMVIYKVLAGEGIWETGLCTQEEFRLWARFEVLTQNGRWVRVQEGVPLVAA